MPDAGRSASPEEKQGLWKYQTLIWGRVNKQIRWFASPSWLSSSTSIIIIILMLIIIIIIVVVVVVVVVIVIIIIIIVIVIVIIIIIIVIIIVIITIIIIIIKTIIVIIIVIITILSLLSFLQIFVHPLYSSPVCMLCTTYFPPGPRSDKLYTSSTKYALHADEHIYLTMVFWPKMDMNDQNS